jgi:hypothetical protein
VTARPTGGEGTIPLVSALPRLRLRSRNVCCAFGSRGKEPRLWWNDDGLLPMDLTPQVQEGWPPFAAPAHRRIMRCEFAVKPRTDRAQHRSSPLQYYLTGRMVGAWAQEATSAVQQAARTQFGCITVGSLLEINRAQRTPPPQTCLEQKFHLLVSSKQTFHLSGSWGGKVAP